MSTQQSHTIRLYTFTAGENTNVNEGALTPCTMRGEVPRCVLCNCLVWREINRPVLLDHHVKSPRVASKWVPEPLTMRACAIQNHSTRGSMLSDNSSVGVVAVLGFATRVINVSACLNASNGAQDCLWYRPKRLCPSKYISSPRAWCKRTFNLKLTLGDIVEFAFSMFSDRFVHYFTDTDTICICEVVDKSVTEHAEYLR